MKHSLAVKLYDLLPLGEVKDYDKEGGGFLYDLTRLAQTMHVLDYPISIPKEYVGEEKGDVKFLPNGTKYTSNYKSRFDLCANFLREWADALESTEKEE